MPTYWIPFRKRTQKYLQENIYEYGGPALNAVITFNILGSGAALVSYFGNNTSMIKVKEDLKSEYGIDVVDLIKGNKYRMPECSIYVSTNSGTRTIVNPPKEDFKEKPYNENMNLDEASVILLDGFVFSEKLKNELRKAREKRLFKDSSDQISLPNNNLNILIQIRTIIRVFT